MDQIENPKTKNEKNQKPKNEEHNENISKLIYILLLYTFFLLAGIYEEKIFKNTYSNINNETGETVKSKFNSPTIALFIT